MQSDLNTDLMYLHEIHLFVLSHTILYVLNTYQFH